MERLLLGLILVIVISGCIGQEETSSKPATQLPVEEITFERVSEENLGDFGVVKNVTVVRKKFTKGDHSQYYFQVEYEWRGIRYQSGVVRKIVAGEGELPVSPPRDSYEHAMKWIRENTTRDSVILSWWDYGDFIRLFGRRETVVSDPCETQACINTISDIETEIFRYDPTERVEDVAKFFMANEDEAYAIAQKYNASHVLLTYEEFDKATAISYIIQDPFDIDIFLVEKEDEIPSTINQNSLETYYYRAHRDHYDLWALDPNRPEDRDKLIVRLLPFNIGYGQGLKHFKQVYEDPERYVYIYKIL